MLVTNHPYDTSSPSPIATEPNGYTLGLLHYPIIDLRSRLRTHSSWLVILCRGSGSGRPRPPGSLLPALLELMLHRSLDIMTGTSCDQLLGLVPWLLGTLLLYLFRG